MIGKLYVVDSCLYFQLDFDWFLSRFYSQYLVSIWIRLQTALSWSDLRRQRNHCRATIRNARAKNSKCLIIIQSNANTPFQIDPHCCIPIIFILYYWEKCSFSVYQESQFYPICWSVSSPNWFLFMAVSHSWSTVVLNCVWSQAISTRAIIICYFKCSIVFS